MGLSRFGGRRRVEGRVCPKGRRRGRGKGRRRRRDLSLIDSRSETAWWIVLARVGLHYGKSLLALQYSIIQSGERGDSSCEMWEMGAVIVQG